MFKVLTKPGCPHCESAKAALKIKNLPYTEEVYTEPEQIEKFLAMGFRTFPQVFDDGKHIGGNDALQDYLIDNY